MRASTGSAGFTVIETLVALVILVAGYLLIQQSVWLGWRGAQIALTERAALRLAQSRLAGAGVEERLALGERSGQTPDGFTWTTRVDPYQRPGTADAREKLAGYWVTVTVSWSEGVLRPARILELKTLKLGVVS